MSEPVEVVRTQPDRLRSALTWAARLIARAAAVGAVSGSVLWWNIAHDRVGDGARAAFGSLLLLGVLLVPAAWLLHVRLALASARDLPGTLQDVLRRRGPQLLDALAEPRRPAARPRLRETGGAVRDYGEVVGSWAVVAQVLSPMFWILTVCALLAVSGLTSSALLSTVARLIF